jgi:glyoxylase-like metal-dependent hydrolase (beta-lactamase superfamily II)
MPQAFEIDFLPVGDATKSGDAITIRLGEYEAGRWLWQKVMVIDGGNLASGNALVQHIKTYYGTNTVDYMFLTHPDGDHASGLRPVIEQLTVKKLVMHRPWRYWSDLKDSIKDGRITNAPLGNGCGTLTSLPTTWSSWQSRKTFRSIHPTKASF